MARIQRKASAYSKESPALSRKLALAAKKPMPSWRTRQSLDSIALWCKANHMSYGKWQQLAYNKYFGGKKNEKNRNTVSDKKSDMGGAE
jgi:hypothetical protein